MALTESTMMELHSAAPDFSLPATSGKTLSLADFSKYDALVVLFICNHCPYVIHIAPALAELACDYMEKNIGFVAINSNDTDAYPADSFELMKAEQALRGYPFPYLYDETQAVAKAYGAACTPDLYVFDGARKLAYRGQFDDTRPHRISSGNYDSGKAPANGDSLKIVLDQLLNGEQPPAKQYPSIGCNIKWRPGNEPS
ncbi:thioredoxin family protein [Teredinibacter waterburyi]|jgi:Thiol-disulfide isomerase and thioredoxins|uniref:thioredoxin family protein n=1 Tax=Teredinibacter waterburyi TaxID=1500538 RepID=UPI00165F51F2|nr:thioredoxin family protein [Teredinibacter waterburyi]